jgi:hypothetical protein
MTQTTLFLGLCSILLTIVGCGLIGTALLIWRVYTKVGSVHDLSARLDSLEAAYRNIRANKAQAARATKTPGDLSQFPQAAQALADLKDEEKSLFA